MASHEGDFDDFDEEAEPFDFFESHPLVNPEFDENDMDAEDYERLYERYDGEQSDYDGSVLRDPEGDN